MAEKTNATAVGEPVLPASSWNSTMASNSQVAAQREEAGHNGAGADSAGSDCAWLAKAPHPLTGLRQGRHRAPEIGHRRSGAQHGAPDLQCEQRGQHACEGWRGHAGGPIQLSVPPRDPGSASTGPTACTLCRPWCPRWRPARPDDPP